MQSTSETTKVKSKYKIKNWKEYNQGLCNRGSLTLWMSEELLEVWEQIDVTQKEVGKPTYPNGVIECCLVLGLTYGLRLRQTTGFVRSLLLLMGKGGLPVPDYTTLCRRQGGLVIEISQRLAHGENLDIAIDSTGLKVYGEGEWKVRKHGVSKRRTWRKLHIGIDVNTQEIVAVELTTNGAADASTGARMLKGKTNRLKSFSGDGAYDDGDFREVLGPDVQHIIPPPKNAVIKKATKKKPVPEHLGQRNQAVLFINEHGSKEWKIQNGYHKRSLNEVAMFRYKTIFGAEMNARKIDNQYAEAKLKCAILNKYTLMGMPVSYKAA